MKSFYYYFRPIAFGFKLLGVFPLDNVFSLDTSKLGFHAFSFSHLYVFFILTSFFVTMCYFCEFSYPKSHSESIQFYVIYGMIGRSVASFIVYGFKNYYDLPKLIQLLDSFDKQKKIMFIEDVCHHKNLIIRTLIPAILIIFFIVESLHLSTGIINTALPHEIKDEKCGTLLSYLIAYLMGRELYSSLLVIYFALAINSGYKQINKILLDKQIKPSYYRNIRYPSDLYSILSNFHELHNILSASVSQLNKVFGTFLAVDQFAVVIILVLNISIYTLFRAKLYHLIMLTLMNAVLVGWVLLVCHAVKTNVSTY